MSAVARAPAGRAAHRIVIVGGGAGGLELATRLGRRLGQRGRARVTLVDCAFTHLWKPLLHEVAAGSLDADLDQVEYLAQARWNHFEFRLGTLQGLDRAAREILLAPLYAARGGQILPARRLPYDTLVIAVGSVSSDLGVPGVTEHCYYLDDRAQADRLHQDLVLGYVRAQQSPTPLTERDGTVVIVGAGATGVELAAELHHSAQRLAAYGFDAVDPARDLRLVLIGSPARILPQLPERVSQAAQRALQALGVRILTGERVTRVTEEGVYTRSGTFIPARYKVWAGGIQAPDLLAGLDGLETNPRHQLAVHDTLQTTRDPHVFAFGDCAACAQPHTGAVVPPTAQAASQQARHLARALAARLEGRAPKPFHYRDYGSLVSIGRSNTVGNLMGNLRTYFLEGRIARFMYWSLYKRHQAVLHGPAQAVLVGVAGWLGRRPRSRLKLH